MKKIILVILSFNFSFCLGQVPANAEIISLGNITDESFSLTNTGVYFKDVDNKYDQWIGTWQYSNNGTIFKIVIQKISGKFIPKGTHNIPIDCYMDLLVGGYYYEKNGLVKTNHLIYNDMLYPPLNMYNIYHSPEQATIYYKEIDKLPDLSGWFVDFTLLPGSTTQAKWEFDTARKRNYSVPDNVILTKQ